MKAKTSMSVIPGSLALWSVQSGLQTGIRRTLWQGGEEEGLKVADRQRP